MHEAWYTKLIIWIQVIKTCITQNAIFKETYFVMKATFTIIQFIMKHLTDSGSWILNLKKILICLLYLLLGLVSIKNFTIQYIMEITILLNFYIADTPRTSSFLQWVNAVIKDCFIRVFDCSIRVN